jgi:hypothetical protein
MDKIKVNEEIATALGFSKSNYSLTREQWIYPEKYSFLQVEVPANSIPDFIGIIDKYIENVKHGIPKQFLFEGE